MSKWAAGEEVGGANQVRGMVCMAWGERPNLRHANVSNVVWLGLSGI